MTEPTIRELGATLRQAVDNVRHPGSGLSWFIQNPKFRTEELCAAADALLDRLDATTCPSCGSQNPNHSRKPYCPDIFHGDGSRWISVKDRLPEKLILVLCYAPPNIVGLAYRGDTQWLTPQVDEDEEFCGNSDLVTHWQLPVPPSAEEAPQNE